MKTPKQIKAWLSRPTRHAGDALYKLETLDYIKRLETVVTAYTLRDGKLEDKDGHSEH